MAYPGHDIFKPGTKLFPAIADDYMKKSVQREKIYGVRQQQGFTLLELAVALLILGIMVAAAISLYQRAQSQARYDITNKNMDAIILALSVYVESAGRIPCPARPNANNTLFGWERGVTAADLQVGSQKFPTGACNGNAAQREGIVPFLTLGIPFETIRDGWGNYFTYSVSPVFARANDASADPAAAAVNVSTIDEPGDIHGRCRHGGWVDKDNKDNQNAIKARFCCADQSAPAYNQTTDIVVMHTSSPAANPISPSTAVRSAILFDSVNEPFLDANSTPDLDISAIESPAFALVSHGPDGLGAYLGNGTLNRNGAAAGRDAENADGDRTFIDGPANLNAGGNHFDDIIRWMTQDGIMAAHGALSCAYP